MKAEDLIQSKENQKLKYIDFKRPCFQGLSRENFDYLFIHFCNEEIKKRDSEDEYVEYEEDKPLIDQLYFYTICSDKFNGNLQKGILLFGKVGSGKSLYMRALHNTWKVIFKYQLSQLEFKSDIGKHWKFRIVTALNLNDYYLQARKNEEKSAKFEQYIRGFFLIDDLGKEPKESNDFGTVMTPIIRCIYDMYESYKIGFMTTNYDHKELVEIYSASFHDRLKQMYNMFEFSRKSRRK